MKSILEEFKVGKCRSVVTFEESRDPIVQGVQPDVVTGRKWRASEEVADAKVSIGIDKIIGSAQCGRKGLGFNVDSKPTTSRLQITDKVKQNIEHGRVVKACQQPSQGRWTNWDQMQVRELSWKDLWNISDKMVSLFLN